MIDPLIIWFLIMLGLTLFSILGYGFILLILEDKINQLTNRLDELEGVWEND